MAVMTPPGSNADDMANLPAEARAVVEAARRADLPFRLRKLENVEAGLDALAEQLGCEVDFLALLRVFKGKASRKSLVVIASARTVINERQLATQFGEVLERADADTVRRATGFAMDMVPPVGLANRLPMLMDQHLMRCQEVWCAAGAPGMLMQVPTRELARITAARVIRLG